MKIIIAPDSYKGNMRSSTVCHIIKEAFLAELPDADVQTFPMADGGEGTVDAVSEAAGGTIHTLKVSGPLGEPVDAAYGLLPDGTAIMEMASASGIELLTPERLNPMHTSTYGTGELLKYLLREGYQSIVMGIGGSATIDGGTGMAQALGYRFYDKDGSEITDRGGQILSMISRIDNTQVLPELKNATFSIACDVINPLTGPNGAATIFGPQKGATPDMIEQLNAGLKNLAAKTGTSETPGDGAAGGLGFGLRAFCSAEIVSGARLIADTVGLVDAIKDADLLITGEGRTDGQTASGKLCAVLAELATEYDVQTLLLSGALAGDLNQLHNLFDYAFSISAGHGSLEACLAHAQQDLKFTAQNVARLLKSK